MISKFVTYLQFMGLDILPKGTNDDRTCLGVYSKESSQPRIQLELKGLIVQQQKDSASDILITWALYLIAEYNYVTLCA
jgi:hypothetical protein